MKRSIYVCRAFLCQIGYSFAVSILSIPENEIHGPFQPHQPVSVFFMDQSEYSNCAEYSCAGDFDATKDSIVSQCTTIDGSLQVSGVIAHPPRCLRTLTGNLVMESNSATCSFYGFGNLVEIEGDFIIHNNAALTSFHGLDALEVIGSHFSVIGNSAQLSLTEVDRLVAGTKTAISGGEPRALPIKDEDYHFPRRAQTTFLANKVSIDRSQQSTLFDEDVVDALRHLDGLGALHTIGGDMVVVGNEQLLSLRGISSLTEIGGKLHIEDNFNLHDLDGLNGVISIGLDAQRGTLASRFVIPESQVPFEHLRREYVTKYTHSGLIVQGNSHLIEVSGMSALAHVYGNLKVAYNPYLTTLCGLHSLVRVSDHVVVEGNARLIDVCDSVPFSLYEIGGDLSVTRNRMLTSVDGFANLETIGGSLTGRGNPSLISFGSGFSSLTSVDKTLSINGNMADFQGFESLRSIGDSLVVSDNPNLATFFGMQNLESIGTNLMVSDNPKLVSMQLGQLRTIGGEVMVTGNPKLQHIDETLEALHSVHMYFQVEFLNGTIDCPKGCRSNTQQFDSSSSIAGTAGEESVRYHLNKHQVYNDTASDWCTILCAHGRTLTGPAQIRMWECRHQDFWNATHNPRCI